jgi:LPS export ABC transporter protein LptC
LINILKYIAQKTPYILGVFVFFISSCENDIKKVRELTAKQDSAIISAENVEINYTTKGVKTVLMKAPELRKFSEKDNESYIEFPKGINMYFYDENGNVSSTLRANYSIYYEEEGKWIAKYDVEAVNEKGEKLNTEYLIWLRDKQTISTDQFVKITTKDGVIYGDDGFVSDQSFSNWEVINGRGTLNIDTNDTIQ